MDYKDYYRILGVPREADAKQIKRAFRKLARELHPDVNPGDAAAEARFKDVAEAYDVLGDPAKREKYDRFGQAWQNHERAGAPGGFDWGSWGQPQGAPGVRYATPEDLESLFGASGGGLGGFSDFFEALFGRGAAGPSTRGARPAGARSAGGRSAGGRSIAGADIQHPVQVTLAEACTGGKRLVNKDGRRLEVTIPPGVRTGSKVRMAGEGTAAAGGRAGDLYLVIEVLDDPRFTRTDDDLSTEVDIPLVVAVLGGEARVPTPTGDLVLTVPPETQNGRRFRLTGKGMPALKRPKTHGDLYVTVRVRLPSGLTDEERELFERLRTLRPV